MQLTKPCALEPAFKLESSSAPSIAGCFYDSTDQLSMKALEDLTQNTSVKISSLGSFRSHGRKMATDGGNLGEGQ